MGASVQRATFEDCAVRRARNTIVLRINVRSVVHVVLIVSNVLRVVLNVLRCIKFLLKR